MTTRQARGQKKNLLSIFIYITGVRIIPEFDAPSHVGNGWQFPGGENFTVCRNKQPW